jgi:hypothetical protein
VWKYGFMGNRLPLEPKQELSSLCEASADESVLLVSDAQKQKVEIKLSTLKSADQLRMAVAKHKEIGAWLTHSTVRKVARGKIPQSAVMRCRRILSWKSAGPTDLPADVSNGQKAKARLFVICFDDPGVGIVKNDSPTLSKDGRQMVLQQVSSFGWDRISFDVSTAFLHGDGDGRLLGIHLGRSETDQCSLEGGAYGRVDAPYLWYCKFRDTLLSGSVCVYTVDQGFQPNARPWISWHPCRRWDRWRQSGVHGFTSTNQRQVQFWLI